LRPDFLLRQSKNGLPGRVQDRFPWTWFYGVFEFGATGVHGIFEDLVMPGWKDERDDALSCVYTVYGLPHEFALALDFGFILCYYGKVQLHCHPLAREYGRQKLHESRPLHLTRLSSAIEDPAQERSTKGSGQGSECGDDPNDCSEDSNDQGNLRFAGHGS
jgi:hypothetical protein